MSSDAIDPAGVEWDSGAPAGAVPQAAPPAIDPGGVTWDAPAPRWNAGDELVNGLLFGQAPRAQAALDALGYKAHAPLVDIPKLLGYGSTEKNAGQGKSYAESLADAQAQQSEFAKQHPYQTAAADTVGNVPGLMAGGGLANAGLRAVGSLGPRLGAAARFLTGEAGYGREALPSLSGPVGPRIAVGPVVEDTPGLAGYLLRGASRTAATAREGAQAGVLTSGMDEGNDSLGKRAYEGGTVGAAAALLTPPALRALSLPVAAYGHLPATVRHGLETGLSAGSGWETIAHAPEVWHMVATNPLQATATLGAGTAMAMSRYLSNHPQIRDALTRWAVRPTAELATDETLRQAIKSQLFPANTSGEGTQ